MSHIFRYRWIAAVRAVVTSFAVELPPTKVTLSDDDDEMLSALDIEVFVLSQGPGSRHSCELL